MQVQSWPPDVLGRIVEDWFVEEDDVVISNLHAEFDQSNTYRSKKCGKIALSFRLYSWVRDLNRVSGITPITSDVAHQYDCLRHPTDPVGLESELQSRASMQRTRNRVFVLRFRR